MSVILYPQENGIPAVMTPVGDARTVADRDVPEGSPYLLCEAASLPNAPAEAWDVDWSNPDGYGGRSE